MKGRKTDILRVLFVTALAASSSVRFVAAAPDDGRDLGADPPPVTRVDATPAQIATMTIHVPDGARAYFAGRLDDERPDLIAWYDGASMRLIAAIEIRPVAEPLARERALRIDAAQSDTSEAASLMTVTSPDVEPALLAPRGQMAIKPEGANEETTITPLLSFEGSSVLVARVPALPHDVLRAQKFEVIARDAAGKIAYKATHDVIGGDIPARVKPGAGRPSEPIAVPVHNPSSYDKDIIGKPVDPTRWADNNGTEVRTICVPANGTGEFPPVQSPVSGRWHFATGERLIGEFEPNDGQATDQIALDGPAVRGPIVVNESGAVQVPYRSRTQISDVTTTNRRVTVTDRQHDVPKTGGGGGGGGLDTGVAIIAAGGVIGALALIFHDEEGEVVEEEQVTIVPVSEAEIWPDEDVVLIEPVAGRFTLAELGGNWTVAQDADRKCKCDCRIQRLRAGASADRVTFAAPAQGSDYMTITVSGGWMEVAWKAEGTGEKTIAPFARIEVDWRPTDQVEWRTLAPRVNGQPLDPPARMPGEGKTYSSLDAITIECPKKSGTATRNLPEFEFHMSDVVLQQCGGKVDLRVRVMAGVTSDCQGEDKVTFTAETQLIRTEGGAYQLAEDPKRIKPRTNRNDPVIHERLWETSGGMAGSWSD